MRITIFFLIIFFSANIYGQRAFPADLPGYYGQEATDKTAVDGWHPSTGVDFKPSQFYKHSPYWKKHKVCRALGWTSLGVGIPAIGVGLVYGVASVESTNPDKDSKIAATILITGVSLTFASIPLFVIGHRNKKKALSLSFGGQSLATPSQNGCTTRNQPAFMVRVGF
ncbi:hypothetical protein [Parabacteroides pacaensis]|uniref:hypothetical protein n=1 Tax=Parabacteroides pacaensis TaxID=2086575 RepID=UPI000D107CCF|nr:hypothetical protein [Parabacteroides pacaensis]